MLLVLPVLLFGCDVLVPVKKDQTDSDVKFGKLRKVDQKLIDQWVAEQKFSKVLGSLESVPGAERSEKDRVQIEEIQKLAEEYETQQSETIKKLYEEGDRLQALEAAEEAFNNYSDGARLWVIKEKIKQQHANYIREVESQILLAKGKWLLQSPPLYEELLSANPGNKDLIIESKQVTGDSIATAARLTVLGIYALSTDQIQLAEQRLTMANALHPTSENITALARLDKLSHEKVVKQREVDQVQQEIKRRVESKKRVEVQRKKQEKEQKESTRLVETIYHSLARGELMRALSQIRELENTFENNSDILRLQDSLDKLVAEKVDALLVEGNELYSNGQIEKAKVVWESALKLNPDNVKINRRIKRAEQVLTKLRELQNK